MNRKIKKAVIIHQGALGDLINTAPAIQALKDNCELLIGIGSERLKLLEYCGIIDKALVSDAIGFHSLFNENFAPSQNFREIFSNADLAISWLGRGSEIYRKNLKSLAKNIFIFQEQFPPTPGSEHITKILAKPVIDAGIEIKNFLPRLNHPTKIEELGPGYQTLVHPGSGSLKKALPLAKLFELLDLLSEIFPSEKISLITGEVEKKMVFEIVKTCPEKLKPRVQLIQDLPLIKLAEMIAQAKIYIGMDSGPTHLASALGIPTIAIFGPTDPGVWAPPQKWVKVIATKYPCAPCTDNKRRECEDAKCMELINGMEIIKAIQSFKLEPGTEKPA